MHLFTKDKAFYRQFFSLLLFIALQNLVSYSVSLADSIMLSNYSQNALSGVTQANQVQFLLQMIVTSAGEGVVVLASQYWGKGEKKPICAKYYGTTEKKQGIGSKEEADEIMNSLKGAKYEVKEVRHGERVKKAPLPFTTSTLQQEASKVLNFSTQKTMRLAQQLYEGVDIKGEGTVGLITYLRTDSTRVSEEAEAQAAQFIDAHYGEKYKTAANSEKKNGQKIQDAHEAIRPTDLNRMPIAIKEQLPRDLFRLYQLIWKRFVASRMSAAQYDTTSVKIQAKNRIFTLAASKMRFDGFMSVYTQEEDKDEENVLGGNLDENSVLEFLNFDPKQHFTQPPAHYTEASLVRALEELGIGRPSTYAPTITTILARRYITKENRNIYVTELGEVVNHMMKEAFPAIVDVNFTANMETLLDGVEEGTVKWKTIVENFYPDLDAAVKKAEKDLAEVTIADEESDEVCELCGRRTSRQIPGRPRISGVPQYQALFREDWRGMSQVRQRYCHEEDQEGQKILRLYR